MKFTATLRNQPTNKSPRAIEIEGTLTAAKSAANAEFKKEAWTAEIVVHQIMAIGEPVLVTRRRVGASTWIKMADVAYEDLPKLCELNEPFQLSLNL